MAQKKIEDIMINPVAAHYSGSGTLADAIAGSLQTAGKKLSSLKTTDLASVDEFHIRGRKATLELAGKLNLSDKSHLLDLGSGLGGPARSVAEEFDCQVTGIDITPHFVKQRRFYQNGSVSATMFHFNREMQPKHLSWMINLMQR